MTRFAFLSEEWLAEARRIRAEYQPRVPAVPVEVRMNMVVSDVPFDPGRLQAHIEAVAGTLDVELGHLERPDLTVTLAYDTARAILVEGDATAAMTAFMSGRIKVDGDITKMLVLQSSGVLGPADLDAAAELARRLQDITE